MTTKASIYLVPVDFTPASISSTKFAVNMANNEIDEIYLLHIIKSDNDRKEAEQIMKDFVEQHAGEHKNVKTRIVEGKLVEEIEQAAKILATDLIILGTHCISGIGKLFNSYAFKIVENSPVPLIIVQEEAVFKPIKKVVMTIDLERESIQIMDMAAHIGKLFNSEIILVAKTQDDPYFRSRRDVNIQVCHKYLNDRNVAHSIEFVDGKDFIENIFELCKEKNADMLAATYYQQHVHLFTDSFVRTLANNELHIPLLTMDEETTHSGGQFGAMFG